MFSPVGLKKMPHCMITVSHVLRPARSTFHFHMLTPNICPHGGTSGVDARRDGPATVVSSACVQMSSSPFSDFLANLVPHGHRLL